MRKITLTKETVRDIKDYFNGFDDFTLDPYEGSDWESIDNVEFQQGDDVIFVCGKVYGRFEKGMRSFDRDVPDDPDEFINDGYEITDVSAYDEDGDNIEITNASELLAA